MTTPTPDPADAASAVAYAVKALTDWASSVAGEPVAELTLSARVGDASITVPLGVANTQQLAWALRGDLQAQRRAAESEKRIAKMADLMVQARRAGDDLYAFVSAALHVAAETLYKPWYLVIGRPGSWEAGIVEEMTRAGARVTPTHPNLVAELAGLFFEMGQARQDGGDVLSQAMGQAVDTLGSMEAFVAGSREGATLRNIAGQYATVDDRRSGGA